MIDIDWTFWIVMLAVVMFVISQVALHTYHFWGGILAGMAQRKMEREQIERERNKRKRRKKPRRRT